ncbi:MAG: family 16 glycosylhydrolase [Planctomycetota bacterium]
MLHALLLMMAASVGVSDEVETPTPPMDDLVLWFAADDGVETDEAGRVVGWENLAGGSAVHRRENTAAPLLVADGKAGRPVLRFEGEQALRVEPLGSGRKSLTVFAAIRRPDDLASDTRWQRVLSGWDGATSNDTVAPSWFLGADGDGQPIPWQVVAAQFNNVELDEVLIGVNAMKQREFFHGELAEILVYDRGFLVYDQIEEVEQYLRDKWDIAPSPDSDWTRVGPLDPMPEHVRQDLPLTDQTNEGGWELFEPLSDEFEGGSLDGSKWWDHNPHWYGRVPSIFDPDNVGVKDGRMFITMKRGGQPRRVLYNGRSVYEAYSSGTVKGKRPITYGYFEIKARPMASAGSSAWWFAASALDAEGRYHRTEIDVFEAGGRAVGHEDSYNMNVHVFETPTTPNHVSNGGKYRLPFKIADDFHIYGLLWTADTIIYYVNGSEVRRVKNAEMHIPMYMIFDSETMPDWLGMPVDEDLPSTFEVEYVRTWKNAATRDVPQPPFANTPPVGEVTDITRYVDEHLRDQ